MIDETFAAGISFFHRLDPRLKIVFAVVFSFFIALSNKLTVLACGLGCAIFFVGGARLPAGTVLKRLRIINIFNLLLWLILPLTFEGDILGSVGAFDFTIQGFMLALFITLKSNTILLAFIALVATSGFSAIGHALSALYLPKKLVYLLMLSYRYVFVLEQEYRRLANAAKIRSFHPATNLHTYKTYAYMFGMLLVRASARGERVYQAMLCRGFDGRFHSFYQFRFRQQEWVSLGLMILLMVVLSLLQWNF